MNANASFLLIGGRVFFIGVLDILFALCIPATRVPYDLRHLNAQVAQILPRFAPSVFTYCSTRTARATGSVFFCLQFSFSPMFLQMFLVGLENVSCSH